MLFHSNDMTVDVLEEAEQLFIRSSTEIAANTYGTDDLMKKFSLKYSQSRWIW